ncbi:hypothetical protein [Methylobacterium tarhaniae]|uniref:hypothetical protein n=1 Tax=Methylobacterium tarhaniae TaxID=1187852 RepID=UPI003CFCDDEF
MTTVNDIFDLCGGPARLGRAIGKRTEHATAMRRRGSIPVAYWPSLVDWAKAEGILGVTHESLVLAHARPRVPSSEGVAGAAA